ncbi:uncharacterized protein TNCV_1944321 [Trichonephila clavipes]|nr:uncharacterized protein TNCV_1944321 [Trichonephila clavipes]
MCSCRSRIIGFMEAGPVARQLGRCDCVVRRCWDQWILEMSFTRRPGSGRPSQTSRRVDRHFVRNARVRPPDSSANIQAQGAPLLGTFSTRGLLATDHVILNHGQVTWTTPELAPPLLTTTPHQREDVSALDRFNVHRCPTRRVFSGTGIELVTRQATIRYLYHSATAATKVPAINSV